MASQNVIVAAPNSRFSRREHSQKIRRVSRKHRTRRSQLIAEMKDVSSEQKIIKEGQRQAHDKLKALEAECDELRKETALIIQQSANTQIRLALMYQILKARENNDFTKAAELTQALRQLIEEQNE